MADLLDVLQQGYMQRALLAGLVVGLVCPAIGVHLVLRRLSLIGDGLGHASFAGVTAGLLVGVYPLLSAAAFALLGAVAIERLRRWRRDYGDLALAIVFYSGIALGVVFAGLSRRMNAGLFGYLFGSILTVSRTDLLVIAVTGGAVLVVLALLSKELMTLAYDEDVARVSGLPVSFLNYLVVMLAAVTVVAALRVVGVLLVAGLLVIPVAASLQVARSFRATLAWAMGFGLFSVLVGLLTSYLLDLAPGGSIVLTAVLSFLLAAMSRGLRGPRTTAVGAARRADGATTATEPSAEPR
jgi:zinc transport system permease protein